MIEILWHGRGGQGAFTASRLLGDAWCAKDGRYGLAFPSFGPERRGAPMCAYTKLSDMPIGNRSAVKQADYAVYLDNTLFPDSFADELKPGGKAIVNTVQAFDDERVVTIDADGISMDILNRAIPNTALCAALATLIPGLTIVDLERSVRACMPMKLQDKNIAVIDAVYQSEIADAQGSAR